MKYAEFYANLNSITVISPAELAKELKPLRNNMVRGHHGRKTGTWSQYNGNPNELPCCFGAHVLRLFDDYIKFLNNGYEYGRLYLMKRLGLSYNRLVALMRACGASRDPFEQQHWKVDIDEFLDRMSQIKELPPKSTLLNGFPLSNPFPPEYLDKAQHTWIRNIKNQYESMKITVRE